MSLLQNLAGKALNQIQLNIFFIKPSMHGILHVHQFIRLEKHKIQSCTSTVIRLYMHVLI